MYMYCHWCIIYTVYNLYIVLVSHDRDGTRPVATVTKTAPQEVAEVSQPSKLPPGRKMSHDNGQSAKPPSSERREGVPLGGKMEVGGSEGEAVVGSKESRTVFVSNLVFSVTEEQLKEKFSEVILYNISIYL